MFVKHFRNTPFKMMLVATATLSTAFLLFWKDNARTMTIIHHFFFWETSDKPLLISVLVPSLMLSFLLILPSFFDHFGVLHGNAVVRSALSRLTFLALNSKAPLALITLCILTVTGAKYIHVRYRIFSEAKYQLEAKDYFSAGAYTQAARVCDEYLRLYPWRKSGAAIPDPVCVPIISFAETFASLYRYFNSTPVPVQVQKDGLIFPAGWEARSRAIEITKRWSGTRGDLPSKH